MFRSQCDSRDPELPAAAQHPGRRDGVCPGNAIIKHLPELVTRAAEVYEFNLTTRGCDCRNAGDLADELIAAIPADQHAEVLEHLMTDEYTDHITCGSLSLECDDVARKMLEVVVRDEPVVANACGN